MNLPRPVNDNVVAYHKRLARECQPTGSGQHKSAKAGRWVSKLPRRPAAVIFDLNDSCSGPADEIVKIGLEMAQRAMLEGNLESAELIIRKVKELL